MSNKAADITTVAEVIHGLVEEREVCPLASLKEAPQMADYSSEQVSEAIAFLIRMGYIEKVNQT